MPIKLVSAEVLLPISDEHPIENGAIAIENDTIIDIGPLEILKQKYSDGEERHFSDHVIMPGLVNAHCHLDRIGFYSRFPFETDSQLSPISWLLEGLLYLSKTPSATVAHLMEQCVDGLLSTGVTCLGAMVHYEGSFPLLRNKIKGVLFQEILSGPDRRAQQRFEVALALIDQYKDANSQLKLGFGPYSAYLLSKNLLNIISRHSKDFGIPLQIHAAEHFAEMEFFFDSQGPIATQLFPAIGWEELPPPHRKTPIQHLSDIGFFTTPISIVGGYHLSESDFSKLARGLVKIVYCPSENRRFNFGQFPWGRLQKEGIPVGLGTALFSTPNGFDLWEEMRLALKEGSNPLPTPFEVLKMATLGGSYSLGLQQETGSLEKGKKADYLVIQKPKTAEDQPDTFYRALIQNTTASSITQVVTNGKIVKG